MGNTISSSCSGQPAGLLKFREQPASLPESDEMTIEFITDVEGNWEYFLQYVSMSSILHFEGAEQGAWGPGTLQLRENCILVFGGDAVDKGNGDIRFTKTLLSLKDRYWDRVFILLGNRDINKLRLYSELSLGEQFETYRPHWHEKDQPFLDYIEKHGLAPDQLSKLRWMLACTMGCGDTTFRTRKQELAIISGKGATDDCVLASFMQSVDPNSADPWMLQLLQVGQLMVVIGDTLFVHAGIQEDSLGFVPDNLEACKSVSTWAKALQSWKTKELISYISQPAWSEGRRGAEQLIEYASPGAASKTVVCFNPLVGGNATRMTPVVEDFLKQSGIRRVLTGHQPHGQSPSVVRHPRTGLLTASCDTSFSNMAAPKHLNYANKRGDVVCVVTIQGSTLKMSGIDKMGETHGFCLDNKISQSILPDVLVGMQLTDGSWIKSTSKTNGTLRSCLGKGFKIRKVEVHPWHACILLKAEYKQLLQSSDHQALLADWVGMRRHDNEDHTEQKVDWSELWSKPFDRTEFQLAETYIVAIHGVLCGLSNPDLQKVIVDKVNGLIATGKRVVFNSTSTEWSRSSLRKMVLDLGINFDTGPHAKKQNFVTSTQMCASFLKQMCIKRPFLLSSGTGLLDELEAVGIKDYVATVDKQGKAVPKFLGEATHAKITSLFQDLGNVDAVVVGLDHSISAISCAIATMYLKWNRNSDKKVLLVVCSMESDHFLGHSSQSPIANNSKFPHVVRIPGSGSICNLICNTAEVSLEPINVGKPSAFMAELMRRPESEGGYGISLESAIVVGHQLETDVELAHICGMKSLLVCSGATNRTHLDYLQSILANDPDSSNLDRVPTWILESFADV